MVFIKNSECLLKRCQLIWKIQSKYSKKMELNVERPKEDNLIQFSICYTKEVLWKEIKKCYLEWETQESFACQYLSLQSFLKKKDIFCKCYISQPFFGIVVAKNVITKYFFIVAIILWPHFEPMTDFWRWIWKRHSFDYFSHSLRHLKALTCHLF